MLPIVRTWASGAVIGRCCLAAVSATGAAQVGFPRVSRWLRSASSRICATCSSASWSLSTDIGRALKHTPRMPPPRTPQRAAIGLGLVREGR